MAKVNYFGSDADQKLSAAELSVVKEREKAQNARQIVREYTSYTVASCKLH